MAAKNSSQIKTVRKTTSIGNSSLSRPRNKSAKRSTKAYRGQGKP